MLKAIQKISLLISLIALTLAVTACGGDEPKEKSAPKYISGL